jgi:cellulose synthase/poly-beta-1,6-N-acetylglucosamine synthase-like glycosyltransferase
MTDRPLVSVLIPARNEAADLARCLEHLAAQDLPHDQMEVIVIDGASTDATALVAAQGLEGHGYHHTAVLRNPEATTPSNLNVGLRYATGDIVCRVDARTLVEPHYVRTCAETLRSRSDIAVVGGAQIAVARDGSARSVGIARALNNRWSMGGSRYRRQLVSGPCETVYLGAFRRAQLLEVHGWDERLGTNQDFDLNRRMSAHGTIWFEASLRSAYVPRASFRELWAQYRRFGRAKVVYWRLTGDRPQKRQQALLAVPIVGAGVVVGAAAKHRLGAAAGLGLLALLGIEAAGTEPRRRTSPAGHLAGAAAMVCVGAGWSLGAWLERLRR